MVAISVGMHATDDDAFTLEIPFLVSAAIALSLGLRIGASVTMKHGDDYHDEPVGPCQQRHGHERLTRVLVPEGKGMGDPADLIEMAAAYEAALADASACKSRYDAASITLSALADEWAEARERCDYIRRRMAALIGI